MAVHQVPLSLGFSRQEHWSGLPFPSPMHGSESLSRVQLLATPWTVACQAPPFMGFSRQEYWNGLLCPSPGDLPDPGIEPRPPALQADSLLSGSQGSVSARFARIFLLGFRFVCPLCIIICCPRLAQTFLLGSQVCILMDLWVIPRHLKLIVSET